MARSSTLARSARLFLAGILLSVTACSGSGATAPAKTGELSEQEKQQLKDLDQQRQSEWGTKK